MSASWDQLWVSFLEFTNRLNEVVEPEGRGFVVRIERHANDVFPFRTYASYSPATAPGEEDLVLSVDFKRVDNEVQGHVDLARGDGVVLAEMPLGQPFDERDELGVAIGAATAALERFVASHTELVDRELRP